MAEKKEPLPLTDRQLEIVNMNATDVTDEELTRVLRELSFRDQRRMAQKVWETYWKVSLIVEYTLQKIPETSYDFRNYFTQADCSTSLPVPNIHQ